MAQDGAQGQSWCGAGATPSSVAAKRICRGLARQKARKPCTDYQDEPYAYHETATTSLGPVRESLQLRCTSSALASSHLGGW